MVASYSRMYFILTLDPRYLLRRLKQNRRKSIGVCSQKIWIITQIHIVLEETYGLYNLHQKSARSHLS